jgi:predicted dehydrogenase
MRRRQFLKSSVAASCLAAAPLFVPARAFGANERVITGHIGVGGQGNANLKGFLKNAAAVCDVDQGRAAATAKTVEMAGNKCEVFIDFRKLLERKDIDAVVISTPDHWHALTTIHACRAGKDVYCEKPLTLTIAEGRKMVEEARASKRVVQTGSQQRSAPEFRRACELVRNGALGKLQTILVGIPKCNHAGAPKPDTAPPSGFDYDLWLGPAPERPYNENRVHYFFRFFWDYSGGQMTNFGAHHLDIAQWALGMDASGPVAVEGAGEFHPQKWHEVTEKCRVTHTYADGTKVIVGQQESDIPIGVTFIGSEGKLFVNRGRLTAEPQELADYQLKEGDVRLYESSNHHENFLACVKSRELPICDIEIGHRSATVCHLGNIAIRLGRKVQWDPAKEQFVGDDEANTWLSRPYRAPWTLAATA